MALYLHIQNSKMVKKIDRTMKIALIAYHSSKKKDPDLRAVFCNGTVQVSSLPAPPTPPRTGGGGGEGGRKNIEADKVY